MKSNKKLNQVVAGTLAASILTGSCTQYPYIDENRIYGNIVVNDSDLGELAIPISLKLKPEDVQYINAIQQVTVDILDSPRKAKAFKKNPGAYLKKYGYNGEINLDDNMLKITMALSDENINKAVKEQDFKTFMKLCKDKNIISSSKGIFENDYYKAQIEKINEREDVKKLKESLLRSSPNTESALNGDGIDEFFLPIVAVIGAIGAVVAAVWALVAVHARVYLLEYTKSYTRYDLKTMGRPITDPVKPADLGLIDVYTLQNGMENTYIAVDNYTEEIINDAIRMIRETYPDFFNNNSETEVRNLLKINILNNIANI